MNENKRKKYDYYVLLPAFHGKNGKEYLVSGKSSIEEYLHNMVVAHSKCEKSTRLSYVAYQIQKVLHIRLQLVASFGW